MVGANNAMPARRRKQTPTQTRTKPRKQKARASKQYATNKREATALAAQWVRHLSAGKDGQISARAYAAWVQAATKRDDLADAFLQGLWTLQEAACVVRRNQPAAPRRGPGRDVTVCSIDIGIRNLGLCLLSARLGGGGEHGLANVRIRDWERCDILLDDGCRVANAKHVSTAKIVVMLQRALLRRDARFLAPADVVVVERQPFARTGGGKKAFRNCGSARMQSVAHALFACCVQRATLLSRQDRPQRVAFLSSKRKLECRPPPAADGDDGRPRSVASFFVQESKKTTSGNPL